MAELIPDERYAILANHYFFLQIKTQQAISGTSAATCKLMEPHYSQALNVYHTYDQTCSATVSISSK